MEVNRIRSYVVPIIIGSNTEMEMLLSLKRTRTGHFSSVDGVEHLRLTDMIRFRKSNHIINECRLLYRLIYALAHVCTVSLLDKSSPSQPRSIGFLEPSVRETNCVVLDRPYVPHNIPDVLLLAPWPTVEDHVLSPLQV